jgi:hypothetical protein
MVSLIRHVQLRIGSKLCSVIFIGILLGNGSGVFLLRLFLVELSVLELLCFLLKLVQDELLDIVGFLFYLLDHFWILKDGLGFLGVNALGLVEFERFIIVLVVCQAGTLDS